MKKILFITLCVFSHIALSKSVMTYNVGLAHTFVPLAKERLPHIMDALKREQGDVVCLL